MDKFFSRIPEPVRFVVANSVNVDSATVVLRVGAPEVNESEPLIQMVKIAPPVPIKSKTNEAANTVLANKTTTKILAKVTNDDYCVVGNYTYTNVDFPVGKIGGDCDSAPKCDNETPQAPIFIF